MLWGDRKLFAIEADFEDSSGKWRFGKLMIWLGGRPLGDDEDTADLASAGRWGRTFLAASAQRTRPDLELLTIEQVFFQLYLQYIVGPPSGSTTGWNQKPYVLDELGESSVRDKHAIVAFRNADGRDCVMAYCWKTEEIWQVILEPGQLDQIIDQFCRWTETL